MCILPRDATQSVVWQFVRLSVRLSIGLSATLRYRDHIGWNSWKIISRLISLIFLLSEDPQHHASTETKTSPNFSRNRSGVWNNWLWVYKTGNISETVEERAKLRTLLLTAYIKSYNTVYQLPPNMILRWPSVPDFPGQSLFLTLSPGKNHRSLGTPICPVFGLASRICPDLTNCCETSTETVKNILSRTTAYSNKFWCFLSRHPHIAGRWWCICVGDAFPREVQA